jgi:hypothetical protein
MSAHSLPISGAAFAEALVALPPSSLYAKLLELRNSIAHLQRSNDELKGYADASPDGDKDCEEAIEENKVVITRMEERIELVKVEMEKRGQKWVEMNGVLEERDMDGNVDMLGDESGGRTNPSNADADGSHGASSSATRAQGDDYRNEAAQDGVFL